MRNKEVQETDYIEIHVEGKRGTEKFSPETYDISELRDVLDCLLKSASAIPQRTEPISLVGIENGSVKQRYKASKQCVAFLATIINLTISQPYLEGLEATTAEAIETLQKKARTKGDIYTISTSQSEQVLRITPTTNYERKASEWIDDDLYLYGEVKVIGGETPKLRIDSDEYGVLSINTTKEFLQEHTNLLYKECGLLVHGKINKYKKEICKDGLELVEVVKNYSPHLDMEHLQYCIREATKQWGGQKEYEEWYNLVRG